jgi:hypothetical protein
MDEIYELSVYSQDSSLLIYQNIESLERYSTPSRLCSVMGEIKKITD